MPTTIEKYLNLKIRSIEKKKWTPTLVDIQQAPFVGSQATRAKPFLSKLVITGIRWLWVILARGWRDIWDIPIHQEKKDQKSNNIKLSFETSFKSRKHINHINVYCFFLKAITSCRMFPQNRHLTSDLQVQRRKFFLLCSLFITLLSALFEAIALDLGRS